MTGDIRVDFINRPPYNWYLGNADSYGNHTTNTLLVEKGFDCANFVSQCLIAGGVDLKPPATLKAGRGDGGTIYKNWLLKKRLATIATPVPFNSVATAPGNLTIGDVLIWKEIGVNHYHATMVVSGTGQNVILASHSSDKINRPLGELFVLPDHPMRPTAYHITGTVTSVTADVTPPFIQIRELGGALVADGGTTFSTNVTVELADSGSGLAGVQATKNEILMDSGDNGNWVNLLSDNDALTGSTYSLTLLGLPTYEPIFVSAWDNDGNIYTVSFTVSTDVATGGGGGGGGEGCVKHGSLIATPQGLRPIESFRPGDPVLGWTGTTTASTIVKHVWVHEGTWTLYEVGGLWLTADHQVLINGDWRSASILSSTPPQVWTGRVYDLTTGLGNFGGERGMIIHNFNLLFLQKRMAHGLKVPSEIFQLGQAFSFPNPAKGVNPTLHVEVGQADEVSATLYTQAGQEVWHTTIPGHQVLIVDGTYAYETSVDVSNLASGIYIAKLTAKKSGQRDLSATVKVAVVK